MQYDEILDLAIDMFCCMQFETVQQICAEISPQLDDDPWFGLLTELATLSLTVGTSPGCTGRRSGWPGARRPCSGRPATMHPASAACATGPVPSFAGSRDGRG
jgi:hypothetical protein